MNHSRRAFLGLFTGSTVAGAGLSRPAVAQEVPVVEMGNNYFDPIGLYVEPGTTVRFEIAAGTHSATAYEDRIPSDADTFDSGIISEGAFEYTFEKPGTYDYYCIPHKSVGMVGRIVVGSPGGPAEESPIPDGEVPESETIVEQRRAGTGGDSGDDGASGGMMGGGMGPGTMNGRTGGWFGTLPLFGGALGVLGLLGGALYVALRRGWTPSESDDPAMTALQRRYAQGDIDEEEFQRRREQLRNHDED